MSYKTWLGCLLSFVNLFVFTMYAHQIELHLNFLKFWATNWCWYFAKTSIPTLALKSPPTLCLGPAWVERSYLAALNGARTASWGGPRAFWCRPPTLCFPCCHSTEILPCVTLSYPCAGWHSCPTYDQWLSVDLELWKEVLPCDWSVQDQFSSINHPKFPNPDTLN